MTAVMGSTVSEARRAERSIGNGDVAQVRSQTSQRTSAAAGLATCQALHVPPHDKCRYRACNHNPGAYADLCSKTSLLLVARPVSALLLRRHPLAS